MKKIAWGIGLVLCSAAVMAAPGEEWNYEGQLDMMGMKMPMKSVTLCVGVDEPKTPPMEGACTYTNVKTQGATTEFEFACTGDDEATGKGTTTVTGDTLISDYILDTADGSGKVLLKGKKGGACDTSQSAVIDGKSVDDMKKKMERKQ